MIEIKWLLYRYHTIKQARETASKMLKALETRHEGYDPNWWIRGSGGKSNPTERAFFRPVDEMDKITQLEGYIASLDMIIAAVDSAVRSLKRELHDIIVLRYMDDLDVNAVAEKVGLITDKGELNMRKYYRLHNIALEGMNIGCKPLEFVYTKDDIEEVIGKLGIVRKSVSRVSRNRVESALLTS